MARMTDTLLPEHRAFVAEQAMFFVATAVEGSRINMSPKGMDSLRVVAPDRILWLNGTGSGNETAAHIAADGRMTLMWCSFAAAPLILRVYGQALVYHPGSEGFAERLGDLPLIPGLRQLFELQIDSVQSSCGFGVPRMELIGERETMRRYAEEKDQEALQAYWRRKNQHSIDGLPTGIPLS